MLEICKSRWWCCLVKQDQSYTHEQYLVYIFITHHTIRSITATVDGISQCPYWHQLHAAFKLYTSLGLVNKTYSKHLASQLVQTPWLWPHKHKNQTSEKHPGAMLTVNFTNMGYHQSQPAPSAMKLCSCGNIIKLTDFLVHCYCIWEISNSPPVFTQWRSWGFVPDSRLLYWHQLVPRTED